MMDRSVSFRDKWRLPSRMKETILVGSIVLFAGLIRIPSLGQPIGPDQGIMAVIGEGILRGKLPYRDFWEMASPAIFYTYALMFKLFGISMAAVPITDTLISMLTTFLIYWLGRSLWGRTAGWLSALIFALFANGIRLGMHAAGDVAFGTFWYIAQRETFMLPLLTASIIFAITSVRHSKSIWRLMLSGFLAGLAFLYKFPSGVIFVCILIYLNWRMMFSHPREAMSVFIKQNAIIVSGFAFAIIPVVVYFGQKGMLGEMTGIIFGYVYSVYGQKQHEWISYVKLGLSRTLFLAKEQFMLWVLTAAASTYIACRERNRENLLIVLWAIASLIYVVIHKEFFGYHFLMILPPFSLLSGYGLARMFGKNVHWSKMISVEPAKAMMVIALLANIFIYTTLIHAHYTKYLFYMTGKISKEQYYDFFTAYPMHDYSFPADYKVSQYIIEKTAASDKIFVLGGIESVVYFLTKRESPSRFIFSWILFSYAHSRVPMMVDYRRELLADLQRNPPAFIITVRALEEFRQYVEIYDFISRHYEMSGVFPDERYVYRRL